MAESPFTMIVQLFKDWEIELLIILSFVLQLFLFFFGALRRRNNHVLLRFPLWLAYLSADSVAIYALGYLSRQLPTTTTTDNDKLIYTMLKLLWAPFFLVHLGGQDTITAFSIEDNELWLRHLLNLLVQVSLVLYLMWTSVAYDRLAVPAIFVFVTGIIKYGERIWALKRGSRKSLKSSRLREVVQSALVEQQGGTELTYLAIVKRALDCEQDVTKLFGGYHTHPDFRYKFFSIFGEGNDSELVFKRIEVELSIMYDRLFTKSGIIHTTLGTILRCVSLTSTMIAFVLFIVMGVKQTYKFPIVDTTITYILFIGALCLEGCSVFILMMSPQTWATLEARGYRVLSRVARSILVKMQPKTRPWWSNSMGQYNLASSRQADEKSGIFTTAITNMMVVVGADELWKKMRDTRYVKVPTGIKQLIGTTLNEVELDSSTLSLPSSMDMFKELIDQLPFEVALLALHTWTNHLLQRARMSVADIPEEMQKLMDQCKGISDYMIHLLVVNPAMLPVSSAVDEILVNFFKKLRNPSDMTAYGFIDYNDITQWLEEQDFHAGFGVLVQVWLRLLLSAAGKCRPEEHARQLAMGGELLTFVWLAMLHQGLGDQGDCGLHLMSPGDGLRMPGDFTERNKPLFSR